MSGRMSCRAGKRPSFEHLEPRLMLSGTEYVVDTLADVVASDGFVTLREALEAANTNTAVTTDVLAGSAVEADGITFDMVALQAEAGVGNLPVITLGGTQLTISDDLELAGPGAEMLTIDAAGHSRVIQLTGSETDATLFGLTLTGGFAYDGGGGIYNGSGTLTLWNSVLSGNRGFGDGGGIFNDSGTVALSNVTVSSNWALNDGCGIYNSSGTLTLSDSSVIANTAHYGYGGIYNDSGLGSTDGNT